MKKSLLLVFISTILLMLGQNLNLYKSAPKIRYDKGLLANGDGFFIGKIAVSEQEGLFKNIAAIAQVLPGKELTDEEALVHRRSFFTSYSRDAFINKTKIKEVSYYYSKTAIHSFFYNLGNYIVKPDPETYLKYLILQKSFLFSFVLSLVILWATKMTNIFTGVLILLSFMFSPIMTLMGRTLYFAPFTFYVPFLVATYLLHQDYKSKINFGRKQYLYIALSFLFHMCFHSYEYISTMGITAITPFVFYGLLKQNWKEFFNRFITAGIAYFCAILCGTFLVLLQYQILHKTDISSGGTHIIQKFLQRSVGAKTTLEDIEKAEKNQKKAHLKRKYDAHNSSYYSVISYFFNDVAVGFYEGSKLKSGIKYKYFMYLFALSALILLGVVFYRDDISLNRLKSKTIILSGLFSFLAPLSWWVIFKPHSYLHSHFVGFVWMLPFTIFGFMLVGYMVEQIILLLNLRKDSTFNSKSINE